MLFSFASTKSLEKSFLQPCPVIEALIFFLIDSVACNWNFDFFLFDSVTSKTNTTLSSIIKALKLYVGNIKQGAKNEANFVC